MHLMKIGLKGLAFPVIGNVAKTCAKCLLQAGELWDMYRGFEIALLKSLQVRTYVVQE